MEKRKAGGQGRGRRGEGRGEERRGGQEGEGTAGDGAGGGHLWPWLLGTEGQSCPHSDPVHRSRKGSGPGEGRGVSGALMGAKFPLGPERILETAVTAV